MYKIAVIDDEPKVLKGLSELLRRSFCDKAEVVSFQNPLAVLEYAKNNEIHILITDICMPEIDGLELGVKLRMEYPMMKIFIISGYSSFDYARTAISLRVCEYLLKPIEKEQLLPAVARVIQELDNANVALEDRNLSASKQQEYYKTMLLRAIRNSDPHALQWLRDFGFENCAMTFVMLEFSQQQLSGLALCRQIRGILEPSGYLQLFLQLDVQRLLWILPMNSLDQEKLEQVTAYAAQEGMRCSIGVSQPVMRCEDIPTGYAQALDAAKQEFYSRESGIYRYASNGDVDAAKAAFSVLQYLLCVEFENVNKDVDTLFRYFRTEHTAMSSVQRVLREVIGQMEPILANNGVDSSDYEKIKIQLDLMDQYHDITAIESDFNRFLQEIKEKMMVVNNFRLHQNMNKAIEYMKEHFREDLSLETVADHINLNASYFSTAFKKYTGSNFVTYLMNLRIEQAKKLLKNPDCKILEIAQASGFHDTRYFARTFKKTVGITPSEYRNIILQLNNE